MESGLQPDGAVIVAAAYRDSLGAQACDVRVVRIDDFSSIMPVEDTQANAYTRRFATLLLVEESLRFGGTATIGKVTNAFGETFALKVFAADIVHLDSESMLKDEQASRIESFKKELAAYRALSGIKGFPKLYGYGNYKGAPVFVMEWVEGETLDKVRRRLAIDDELRMAPLNAARLARDLLEVLSRMDVLNDEVIHCDLTPANVMVDLSCASLEEQVEEGRFEIKIIDLGSAITKSGAQKDKSHGVREHETIGASPSFAAPELLVDAPDLAKLDGSADVHSAAVITYLLMAGHLPFESVEEGQAKLAFSNDAQAYSASNRDDNSAEEAVERRRTLALRHRQGAHSCSSDIAATLRREPEVAVSVAHALSGLGGSPSDPELREALSFVDDRLEDIIEEGLASEAKRRPYATDAFLMLDSFCGAYCDNVGRSIRGERLIWPDRDDVQPSDMEFSHAGKVRFRRIGKAALAVIGLAAILVTLILLLQTGLWVSLFGAPLISAAAISVLMVALVIPSLLALGLGRLIYDRYKRFVAISAVIFFIAVAYAGLYSSLLVYPGYMGAVLAADLFLSVTIPWSWSVLNRFMFTEYQQIKKRLPSASEERLSLEGEVA